VSNFEYLKKEKKYDKFVDACIEAERLMNVSYSATATFTRRALELTVKWVYANDGELKVPYQDNLASLRNLFTFTSWIDYCYSEEFHEIEFAENLLEDNNRFKKTAQEKEELFEILSQKDRKLEEVEVKHMDNSSGIGFVNYVLYGDEGNP
jgi:type I restriction enzyme R subunit